MIRWLTQRRWKRAVEEAIGAAHGEAERERLVAEVIARLQARLLPRVPTAEIQEAATQRIVAAARQQVDRQAVQTSLGLRYLERMQDRLRRADYEDVGEIEAEVRWLEAYLMGRLHWRWMRAGAEPASTAGDLPKPEELSAALAARAQAVLEAAAAAA